MPKVTSGSMNSRGLAVAGGLPLTLALALTLALGALAASPALGYTVVQERVIVTPHRYLYYRDYPIYCDPLSSLWFWLDGDVWYSGYVLPARLQVYLYDPVTVYYRSSRPYVYYRETWRRYPPRRHYYRAPVRHDAHNWQHWHGRYPHDNAPRPRHDYRHEYHGVSRDTWQHGQHGQHGREWRGDSSGHHGGGAHDRPAGNAGWQHDRGYHGPANRGPAQHQHGRQR